MASSSQSTSGQNFTVTVSFDARLANYGGSGRDAICRQIYIEADGGGYVLLADGLSATSGVDSASYTWTFAYGSSHTWDAKAYYTDVNTGANGAYRETLSGSVTMPAAPAPAAPATPSPITGSQSGTTCTFSWANVGASGYTYSGSIATANTTSTSVSFTGQYGSTYNLSVQAYNTGDGVNTSGTTYSGTAGPASVYLAYPPPSTPSTPTVSGSYSGTTVTFSWNSTGGGYHVYVNGALYTDTASTSVSLTEAVGSTTSCYVQAYNTNQDGVTASSGNSNTASVTIPNPPSAPSVPTLSGSVSGTTVTLSWTDVSATGYNIYRGGAFLKQVTGAVTTTDTGLTPATTYQYYVVAYNSNSGGTANAANSNTVSEYVPNPPAAPAGTTLTATAHTNGDGTVDLSWTSVTCTGYRITRDGTQISDTTATSLSDTGLARGSSHSYSVTTYNTNADGTTLGPASNTATVAIPDVPAAPAAITISGTADSTTGSVSLSWTNVSASRYDVYRDGTKLTSVTTSSYKDTTPTVATHTYYVNGFNTNAVGDSAATQSNTINVTVPVPPPPAAPSVPNLSGTATNSQQGPNYVGSVTLSWTNVSATGYRVYRNGSQVQVLPGTTFTMNGLPYNENDSWFVIAYNQNAGGTTNAQASNTVTTTIPLPDPPPAPAAPPGTTLSAQVKYQSVTVYWTSVSATGYRVIRDGSVITNVTVNNYTETRPPETYSTYSVQPYNSATNPGGTTTTSGPQSNNVQVLTKALPPDSAGTLMG